MKLLIADDDETIRQTFLERIPWKENGFEIVGVAANGQQAYEMALSTCPDIVLSDIEMPYLTGLQLAEKLQEVLENCRIIFLTAYDNFSYAKEALRLHANEYILKDAQEDEVLGAVKRAAEEIRERNRNVHLTKLGEEQLEKNRIGSLLQENISIEEREKNFTNLGMRTEGKYRVAVLKLEMPDKNAARPSEIVVSEREVKELLTGLGEENIRSCWVTAWNQYQVLIFDVTERENIEEYLGKRLKIMVDLLEDKLSYQVTAAFGRNCEGAASFVSGFDDAMLAVNDDTQGKIRYYRELGQSRFISQIRDYILENYADPGLNLSRLSEEVFLTPTYISSLFKRYTNMSFKEYLINIRMKKACRLLEKTDLKSYEISALVGYPNPQYFSVLFKKYTGESPTQYHDRFHGEGRE